MSVRLVSSAKNLREQFKGPNTSSSSSTLVASSNASIYTASSGVTRTGNLEPPNGSPVSRQGSLLRSTSNGTLRRTRSIQQRKGIMSKVFADDEPSPHSALPDLSMEMTLLIVKRCIKEIRERGLTTKGILRQVQMGQNQKVVIDTIRMILDDDVSTELSPLHQVDIHLVAHAMKWAIRYSEETLVTYEDYQALYLNQDRNFSRFVHDLPPTNRAILLDLFSLCADVTLLAHLNNMTLVSVAKAISLSIMAEPEREFTTFDASLQQRNLWGAASEDLLRAFLRIKTTYDLARIEQEDEVDENRYICNETRVLKSARQRPTGVDDQARMALPARLDISVPSSANSSSIGWSANNGPMSACTPRSYATANGYFDNILPPHSASPYTHSHAGGMFGASLSRSQSLAKSEASNSRPLSPATHHDDEVTEYEELMQDKAHFTRIRQDPNNLLRPAEPIRRRSSVTDLENLYMLPMDIAAPTDGYESDPEVSHKHKGSSTEESLIPDFADGLGWDFNRAVDLETSTLPSLTSFQNRPENKCGVIRSNSASSNGSGIGPNGPSYGDSPRSIRDLSKQQLHAVRLRQLQDQHSSEFPPLHRAQSQQDRLAGDHSPSPMDSPIPGATHSSRARVSHAIHPSHQQQQAGRHSPPKRNSGLRRSISLDPFITHGRIHKKPNDLQSDLLTRELALQVERDLVAEDIRAQLLKVRDGDQQAAIRGSSEFELQSSPQDLEPLPGMSSRRPSLLPTDERPVHSSARRPSLLPSDERPILSTASSRRPSLLSSDERPFLSAASSRRPSLLPSDERPSILSRRPSFLATDYSANPKPMLELDMANFPISPLDPAPLHPFQLECEGPRKFENASQSRDLEVNVVFNPIPLTAPAEHKSKFQESFPEHPVSPPPGYATRKGSNDMMSPSASTVSSPKLQRHGSGSRTLNGPPSQSNSVASSSISRNRPPALSQSVSYSGVSTSSSLPSANGEGGRSKTSGFIRALSSKLRSKQSDDQLRPVRVNNQLVGAAASPPTLAPAMAPTLLIPPAVSIEPPRLQLNFLDDVISPAIATAATTPGFGSSLRDGGDRDSEHDLPPTSAPALMLPSRAGGSAGTLEGWKRDAQDSLPMSTDRSGGMDEETTGPNNSAATTAGQDPQDLRPKGFTGVRRASATVFGSGHHSHREQHRTLKKEASSPSLLTSESPLRTAAAVASPKDVSAVAAAVRAIEASTAFKNLKQEPQDLPPQPPKQPQPVSQQVLRSEAEAISGEGSIPKKTDADENEFRFSTATLLKDGKLYYQLQWDQFSELGFKAPEKIMTEKQPDQNPDGIHHHHHHPRLSQQEDPWRQSSSSAMDTIAAMTATETTATTPHPHHPTQQQQQQQMTPTSTTAANSGSISLDLPGQIGQVSMSRKAAKLMGLMEFQQDQGPSGTLKEAGPPEELIMSKKAAKLMGLMEFQQDQGPNMTQRRAGPSEAQKAAAMVAARESFKALAKDPQAMAALKAGSNGGTGQPTIIGTGSFRRGSIVPEMEMNPLVMKPRPIITSKLGMRSAERDECDSPRGSMSATSSPLSSAAGAAPWSDSMTTTQPGSVAAGGGGPGSSASSPSAQAPDRFETMEAGFLDSTTTVKAKKGHRLFGRKIKSVSKKSQLGQVFGSTASPEAASLPSIENGGKAGRKKRLLPAGVRRQDVMTKTVESMDEVFPWMCIEHMAGQESGWVMLEPVQDGAVGWVVIDKLEDEMEAMVRSNQSVSASTTQAQPQEPLDATAS